MKKELLKTLDEYEQGVDDIDLMLTRIHFFEHERLIHLIVTSFTGILAIIIFVAFITLQNIALGILFVILLLLFIPYIIHYYTLENGVQKLHKLYIKNKRH